MRFCCRAWGSRILRVQVVGRAVTKRGEKKKHTLVNASFADVSDGGALDHVPDCEPLNGLVLSDAARAIRAAHEGDMAAALLVAASVSSFFRLGRRCEYSETKFRPLNELQRRNLDY
jgi:hypothetical protein